MSPATRRPRSVRLQPLHRRLTEGVLLVLALSGAIWLALHWLADPDCEAPACAIAWLRPTLALHGAAAMVALLLVGSVLERHVLQAWREGRNRVAGAFVLGFTAVLALTGWGLYYLGGELARDIASDLHSVLGLAIVPVFVLHLFHGRRRRRVNDRHLSRETHASR